MNKIFDLATHSSSLQTSCNFPISLWTSSPFTRYYHRHFLGCSLPFNTSVFFVELTWVLVTQWIVLQIRVPWCLSGGDSMMWILPRRVARKLKKPFGELKTGSSDSITLCGSRPVYKSLEEIPAPLDKPLSKQLLNEYTFWESPLCSCFHSLVSKMIQVGKWVTAMLWFHKSSSLSPTYHDPWASKVSLPWLVLVQSPQIR